MRRRLAVAAAAFIPVIALAGQPWSNLGRDPRHSGRAPRASQPLEETHWSTPVDLAPHYDGDDLLIHYGTPLVTRRNTVVLPVKTGASGGFRIEAHRGRNGAPLWSFDTDYVPPPSAWMPSCGACLARGDRVVAPAAGGTLLVRVRPDRAGVEPVRVAFFGVDAYLASQSEFDATVRICTPITSDAEGTLYFGFRADPGAPLSLVSGIARIPEHGDPTWIAATEAVGDPNATSTAMNCAPALSPDGRRVYVAVRNDLEAGWLCCLNSRTLARETSVRLRDAKLPAEDVHVVDVSTASPTVGPDGDVYFGVIENSNVPNGTRGWLLHFDGDLSATKIPGSFGWDDTASIVPASAVPAYAGGSKYLLLTKSNDYVESGGTGVNRLAVLDPGASAVDPRTGASVMVEVLTVAGPTPDEGARDAQHPDAVREWCINTAAIDVKRKSALVNNEDGVLYRWDFRTNTLTQSVVLTAGIGEAYTPTIVGPDGQVYAINNATLFAVGRTRR